MRNPNLLLDVEEKPSKLYQWFLFSIQHVLAMLVACITVPLITGLPVAATIIAAGLGTTMYLLITKLKSPVFLSSSFTFVAPIGSALAVGEIYKVAGDPSSGAANNYGALMIGMILVALVYLILGIVIRFVGTKWIDKLLPPIVIGPIIMVIGLSLATSAIANLSKASALYNQYLSAGLEIPSAATYNLVAIVCGLVALVVTALCAHYGKGKIWSLIPYVIGMASGYIVATIFTVIGNAANIEYLKIVDFSAISSLFSGKFDADWIFNYHLFVPNDSQSFIFLRFNELKQFNWANIGSVILIFVPIALVSICEHIGDHKNVGNIIERDLLNGEPNLKRTIVGGGLATGLSGILGGGATTTYGENVAVVGTTRIASTRVVLMAAITTTVIGLISPLTAAFQTIPSCVTGGIALILYGFIAGSGLNLLIKERIDFTNTKNIFIAGAIWISGIGGLALKFGNPSNPTIEITPLAVAMILGILMNLILKDPKVEQPKE